MRVQHESSELTGRSYPHDDGDTVVIGPECFSVRDGSVLSWRGENYYADGRLVAMFGWLSAELAGRAEAWNGNAPPWFPEPPEWLDLLRQAIEATASESPDV